MTLWLKIMYHNKKFGYKRFSGGDDIVQQTVTEILNVCCDLDLENSHAVFSLDTLAYDDLP